MSRYKGIAHLAALILLVPLAAWKLAIGDTVGMWLETRRISGELGLTQTAPGVAQGERVAAADEEMIESGLLMGEILELANAAGIEVVRYTPFAPADVDGLSLCTAEITLKGAYVAIVRTISEMEASRDGCRIVSLGFRTVRKPGERRDVLHATVIMQQITQKTNSI